MFTYRVACCIVLVREVVEYHCNTGHPWDQIKKLIGGVASFSGFVLCRIQYWVIQGWLHSVFTILDTLFVGYIEPFFFAYPPFSGSYPIVLVGMIVTDSAFELVELVMVSIPSFIGITDVPFVRAPLTPLHWYGDQPHILV